jgi:hypothetical protein
VGGERELPEGGWWYPDNRDASGLRNMTGIKLSGFAAVFAWDGPGKSIVVARRRSPVAETDLLRTAIGWKPKETQGPAGAGYFVEYKIGEEQGLATVFLPDFVI